MKTIEKSLFLFSILLSIGFSYVYADSMHESGSMDNKMMDKNMSDSMNGNHMMNDSMSTHDKNMMSNSMMHSEMNTPMYQTKHGVSMHDVKCSTGLSLIFKTSNDSPTCVRPSTATILIERGWAKGDSMGMSHTMSSTNNNSHEMMNDMKTSDHMMNKSMTDTNDTMPPDVMSKSSIPMEKHGTMTIDESKFRKSPGLLGITDYINTTPDELQKEMKGKVILYDFWTFNCINCIHTIPFLNQLNAKYADKGMLIIGIHSPETPTERDPNNVRNAVEKDGIKYPVVLDTNFETWNAFGNHYWPRQYIVDTNGYIRYDHIGEGNYDEIENEIKNLLAE